MTRPDDSPARPEPTDLDYIEGRARFTSVAEWAQTGRRLDWTEELVDGEAG